MSIVKSIKAPAIVPSVRISLVVLIALLPGLFAAGQTKFTTVASSQEVGRGEYLQVEFVVENAKEIVQFTPPDFPGFQIAQGPIQSSGMSIINGNTSQYKSLSFVLQPVKTGKFTIQGASALVDGKQMRSNPITITVTASSSSAGNGNNNNPNNTPANPFRQFTWPDAGPAEPDVDVDYMLKPGENVKEKIRKNLFVRVQVDKNSCYVGEPIVATYKLYSRLNAESRVTKRPSLNGFSVYDMIDPGTDAVSREQVNGKTFTVHTIRKTQLIPLQAGTINLDPLEVENTVHFVKGGRQTAHSSGNTLKDLFDQLSDDNTMGPEVEENVTLDTKPFTITVKPLPQEKRPANFNGAVGNFSIQAVLKNPTVAAQDEGDLQVTIRGKGNLPVLTAPTVQWPSGMDAFDPTAKEDINKTTVPMSGSKTFDYLFTPDVAGHYTIPAITFSYFDPATQSYKEAGTDSLEVQVTPAVKRPGAAAPAAGNSVVAASSAIDGWKKVVQQHLEWIFAILILSGLAVYLWRQNIRLKKAEEEKLAAERKAAEQLMAEKQSKQVNPSSYDPAPAIVIDPLQEARLLFTNGDYKGFYRELSRAIWKVLADKLDLPSSELNKPNIIRQLEARGQGTDTILSLESILNECEMNLYTPAYDTHNMQQLLWQTESLLNRL